MKESIPPAIPTTSIMTQALPDSPAFEMIKIEGGPFTMGNEQYDREKPAHLVDVPDFYLSKYPVTNKAFAFFLNDYGSDRVLEGAHKGQKIVMAHDWGLNKESEKWEWQEGYDKHPIINVSWYGAAEYCRWLSQKTGFDFRLPSEAQWEYAARGGNQSQGFPYSGGNKLKEVGWYADNSHQSTKPVGLKLENELGLYDMSGNVWDWCADVWQDNYKGAPKDGSAWLDGEDTTRRVLRGGSWDYYDDYCRVSNRNGDLANFRFNVVGFRVSRY